MLCSRTVFPIFFVGDEWLNLPSRLKETACMALYYAINWIKELLNTYSTQIQGLNGNMTQATREEISSKLLKRLRNLLFLELLLAECMKSVPSLAFPLLHSETEAKDKIVHGSNVLKVGAPAKRGRKRKTTDNGEVQNTTTSQCEKNGSQVCSDKHKQSNIHDCSGNKTKETQVSNHSQGASAELHQTGNGKCEETPSVKEKNEKAGQLEEQRWKFRPLNVHSLSILGIPQDRLATGCCPDRCAELPLHLYILHDLHHKLECLDVHCRKPVFWAAIPCSPKAPSGLGSMAATQFLEKLKPLFPSLRRHLDTAATILCRGSTETDISVHDACEEHGNLEALGAGNPESALPMMPTRTISESVLLVIIRCLSKIFSNPELMCEHTMPTLMELLLAISTRDSEEKFLMDLHPPPTAGSLEYALCSAYSHLDELFDAAASTCFSLTTELVMAQKALVTCAEGLLEVARERMRRQSGFFRSTGFLPYLKSRLSESAGRVLRHQWEDDGQEKISKSRGDVLQPLLQIFLQFNDSPLELLEELASNVMPQVPVQKARNGDPVQGYPTLCQGNFLVWYRVQHEELLKIFGKVVKDIITMQKSKSAKEDDIDLILVHARQCSVVLVLLVNLTKMHCDKVAIHSVAVKFGGKFVDTFLKAIDFWQAQYAAHRDSINAVVKELQKATRTIQTLCSEAKGSQKMPITSKVPAVKRSLERYVFCIKALLHSVSQGNSFWMGNLKHKNLRGEEVGSQLPVSEEEREEAASVGEEDEEEEQVDHNDSEEERVASGEI